MVNVESPETAAASSSESSDFAVPGSPTRSRPRVVASVTSARSMSDGSPTNLRSMPARGSPTMKRRAASRLSCQPGGLSPASAARSVASSSAQRLSAGGRWTRVPFGVAGAGRGSLAMGFRFAASPAQVLQIAEELGRSDWVEHGERPAAGHGAWRIWPTSDGDAGDLLLLPLHRHAGDDAGIEGDLEQVA